jgi:hypothetical protein
MWYCKILKDLPHPPKELIEKIDMVYRPAIEQFNPDNTNHLAINDASDWKDQEYNWIKPMASNNNVRYRFNGEYTQWVKENIVKEFSEHNSGVMFFDEEQLPHTDTTREYVLLYNIETGGDNVSLSFWQEQGYDIKRNRGLAVQRGSHLKLLEKLPGPFNCWYLMDTQVLHSVEGMSSRRVNFQISFNELPQEFV